MLFMDGIPDTIIREMTGNTSGALERYKHLDLRFANQSVERIGGRLSRQIATNSATPLKITATAEKRRGALQSLYVNGGADGTRTRDLRRDRPAF